MADDTTRGFTAAETARFEVRDGELYDDENLVCAFNVTWLDKAHTRICALLNEQDATITQLRENIQHLRTELVGHQLRVEKLEAIETRARLVRDRQLGGRTGIAITQEMNYVLGENKP